MTTDGGGWTLLGSVVNDGSRSWDTHAVWTDTTTFGAVDSRQSEDVKDAPFYDVDGDDLLITTDEYAFAFYSLLGSHNFADYLDAEYSSAACSTSFLKSGADWSDGLDADQESLQSFSVRPGDDNASCFPSTNENTIVGMPLAECCWTPVPGSTPGGQVDWKTHDLSPLQASYFQPQTCTTGSYPWNDNGLVNDSDYNCYDESCKVTYTEMYVR